MSSSIPCKALFNQFFTGEMCGVECHNKIVFYEIEVKPYLSTLLQYLYSIFYPKTCLRIFNYKNVKVTMYHFKGAFHWL